MTEKRKSKMPPEERARRRVAVGKSAAEKIAKSEQLNFRLEEQSIKELQQLAYQKDMPLGTMIRSWVLDRLAREKIGRSGNEDRVLRLVDEFQAKLSKLYGAR